MGISMLGFDYANARLRAMKSRLLSVQQLHALAESDTDEGLLIALAQTPYQPEVESAMVHASGLGAVDFALQQDLINTVRKIRTFFSAQEQSTVRLILRFYDVHNLKVILRSVGKHIPVSERLSALLPIGDLTDTVLSALANTPSPGAAIDLLASMQAPLARPLVHLRNEKPGAETVELELALERWHIRDAFAQLETTPRSNDLLSAALALDADVTNLQAVIQLAHAPSERAVLRQRLGDDGLGSLWVGPGYLDFTSLEHAAEQNSLEAAVDNLSRTAYRDALVVGMQGYRQSGQLSSFERALRHFRLSWMAKSILKDPLGIGVLLGYLALKLNEIRNLRWIAHGIHAGVNVGQIHEGLEIIS